MIDICRRSQRNLLGYAYNRQVVSNPTVPQRMTRSLYNCYDFTYDKPLYELKKHAPEQVIPPSPPGGMSGEGVFSDAFDSVYKKAASGVDHIIDEAQDMAKHARRTTAQGIRKAANLIEGSGLGVAGASPAMYDVSGSGCCGAGMLPGDELKLKLLKQMSKKNKRSSRIRGGSINTSGSSGSSGGALPQLSTPELTKFLVKVAIPKMFKNSIHLPKPAALLNMVKPIVNAFKGDTMKIVKHIAAKIIPPVAKSMMHIKNTLGMRGNGNEISKVDKIILKHAGFRGSGISMPGGALRLAGQRGRRGQGGRGIAGDISGVLVKGLFNMVKAFLGSKYTSKVDMGGNGMRGGNFTQWFKKTTGQTPDAFGKDFVKGFSFVFKPGAKILSPIAKAVGIAPLGMALDAVGKALPTVGFKDLGL